MFANGCFVGDAAHRFDDPEKPITWQGFTSKGPVQIGSNCWFGVNCVVTSGVTIGDRCVIGANSVVTEICPGTIAAGAPAKPIGNRLDYDSSSGANNSGASLDQTAAPEWLAGSAYRDLLRLLLRRHKLAGGRALGHPPAGRLRASHSLPLNVTPPMLSPGAGNPRAGDSYTATPGTWEFSDGSFTSQSVT